MSGSRRKAGTSSASSSGAKRAKKSIDLAWTKDDEIVSDDDFFEENHTKEREEPSSEEEEEETVDAKRVRLARAYLEKIEADESSSSSEEEELSTRDRIGRKLQKDRLKRQGTYERAVAQTVANDIALMQREISAQAPTTRKRKLKRGLHLAK